VQLFPPAHVVGDRTFAAEPPADLLDVLLAFCWSRLLRRERALVAEVRALAERVRELSTHVEAAEADVAHAVTQTEIAESLLLEKGVADEEDIEEVRRRFGGEGPVADDVRGREELH
jgi:hypothetical protein